jgi:hypothetical protein
LYLEGTLRARITVCIAPALLAATVFPVSAQTFVDTVWTRTAVGVEQVRTTPNDDAVIVTDLTLERIDSNGLTLWTVTFPITAANVDQILSVSATGTIAVALTDRVVLYDGDGTLLWEAYLPGGAWPRVLTTGDDGSVYATYTEFDANSDATWAHVVKLSPAGVLLWDSFLTVPAGERFIYANCVAVTEDEGVLLYGWYKPYWHLVGSFDHEDGSPRWLDDVPSYPTMAVSHPWGGAWDSGWIWGGTFYMSQFKYSDSQGWGWGDEAQPTLGVAPDGDILFATIYEGPDRTLAEPRLRKAAVGLHYTTDYQWTTIAWNVEAPHAIYSLDSLSSGDIYIAGQDSLSRIRVDVLDDGDGDGYGAVPDCDDTDASVYPGALDIPLDGIDQNCNGYDMTIEVDKATVKKGVLKVQATSALGYYADLWIEANGRMTYDFQKEVWSYEAPLVIAPASPGDKIYIYGDEGTLEVPIVK